MVLDALDVTMKKPGYLRMLYMNVPNVIIKYLLWPVQFFIKPINFLSFGLELYGG
jgi:hypothetical protein